MVVPKGYKETEIGILPADWNVLKIGEIIQKNKVSIQTGPFGTVLNASEYSFFGTPVISVREIRNGSIEIFKETPRVSLDICKKLPQYILKKDDLVFARKGNVERSSIITNKEHGFFLGSDGIRLRFLSSEFNAKYAAYFFHSHTAQSHLLKASYGSTMAGLNETIISQLVLAFPMQKGEQESVASALSEIDELIISLEKLIEKKKQIRHGAMQKLLSNENKRWKSHLLGEICDIQSGTIITENKIIVGSIPVIAGGKSPAYYHVESNRTSNTITISASGANAGFVSFHTEPIFASDCSTISESDTYDVKFIYYSLLFKQNNITSMQSGGAQPHVRPSDLKSLMISIPPFLNEQYEISEILSDMESEIETLAHKLEKYRKIKQGMMQELLTGRIRLMDTDTKKQRKGKKVSRAKPTVQPQGHNEHFYEAVILSAVVSFFASEKYPLGRFRRQKLAYLLHRHAQESTQGFLKKAAGPYNPTIRYKDEKIALKAGYVAERGNGKFVKGEKTNEAVNYFTQWYGTEAIEWLKQFQFRKNDELEVLTTVAEAIADLKRNSLTITVESIKQVIQSNPEWRPKLDKTYFNDINIQSAMRESQKLFA